MSRTAIIGLGNMGKNHYRVCSEFNELLPITCDNDKEAIYCDYHCVPYEFIDYAIVSVPTHLHKEIAIYCIEQGANVLIEKPITNSIEDAYAIKEAAKKHKVKVGVGHTERFNPVVKYAKKNLKKLGNIIDISTKRVGPTTPKDKGLGVAVDLAIHDIDVICFLLNKSPKQVFSVGNEDNIGILLNFGASQAHIQANWVTPEKIRTLTITGTKGYLEADYIKQTVKLNGKDIPIKYEEPLKNEHKEFIKGKFVTIDEAINNLKISLKARR